MIEFAVFYYDRSTRHVSYMILECACPACAAEEVMRRFNGKAVILSIYALEFDESYELEGGETDG